MRVFQLVAPANGEARLRRQIDARRCGVALLGVFSVGLLLLGGAYLALAATTTLLPGDVRYLGMGKPELCQAAGCHIVDFITHNRAAYGGAIVASGVMSAWTVAVPLREGEAWAWWALLVAGAIECACSIGFIAYGQTQSYGFGPWHVVTIAAITAAWAAGLALTRPAARGVWPAEALLRPGSRVSARTSEGSGRLFFVFLATGFLLSGFSVLMVALTTVFVPQDMSFLGVDAEGLGAANDRLLALVAHDRAEFGVGMMTLGVLVAAASWKGIGVYGRSLWLSLGAAGSIHFAAVIVSHFSVGYTDFVHLAPVYGAAMLLAVALYAWRPRASARGRGSVRLASQASSTSIDSP